MNNQLSMVYEDVFKCKTQRRLSEKLAGQIMDERKSVLDTKSDFDYSAIDQLLLNNKLADISKTYIEINPIGDILLTGSTGFLGIHVLKEIIERHQNKVYCLVREKKNISSEDRLKSLLHYYFENDYAELFGSRIFAVNGDITKPETLTVTVDTVINCAANVKHFAHGDELDQINIGGVVNLIEYCRTIDAILIHVSTISVGDSVREENCQTIFREDMLYFGQDLENRYIYSKFIAERHILKAASEGLRAKIMRVGNLMSRNSDGEFQINANGNAFMSSLRAYSILGAFPISVIEGTIEFSPIDSTAEAVLKLSSTSSDFTVFHPVNTHKVFMSDVLAAMNDYELPIEVVDDVRFAGILQEKFKDENAVKYLVGILAYQKGAEAEQIYKIAADNSFTSNTLIRLGFKWPITSEDYIKRAIEAIDGLGYFDIVSSK